jgi:hypothetical protein
LVVIGVHTPEFSFEHELDRVQRAVEVRAIDYPVAIDNDYEIWDAFGNNYWPALYFVDREGVIRDHQFGEGNYEDSERLIQQMLGVDRNLVIVEGRGVEAEADWEHLQTPETYLGYSRSTNFALPSDVVADEAHAYERPDALRLNQWALAGDWTVGPESVALNQAGGSIAFRFDARDVHLVLSTESRRPLPFRVLLDGEDPGPAHGLDIDKDGTGALLDGRLYQLVRQRGDIQERTVQVTFLEPGAEAYVFTFG